MRDAKSEIDAGRRRVPLLAVGLVATSTLAACAFAVGCSKSQDDPNASASLADKAPEDTIRRVCPSSQNPDGSWVKVDGFDTSDYEWVDWDAAPQANPNMKFAFVRVSAGTLRVDTRFAFDWPALKRTGLIRGAYQYFKPSQSAVAQADLFLQRVREAGGLDANDFPPVLDFETTNGMPADTILCRLKIWLTRIERETRRLPIIYASANQNEYLSDEFARYPLWVPNYVATPSMTCPRTPDAWRMWTFWQYGGAPLSGVWSNGSRDDDAGGSIAHQDGGDGGPIVASADVNYFDGTLEHLRAFVGSTTSDGTVGDPPPLAHPPHVLPDAGISGPLDCDDGCCVMAP
jgi:lysozyme